MSSGQPKACWANIEVERYVTRDHWPYKPFKIAGIGEDYVRLKDPVTGASKRMTPKEFDAARYVFAEMDATPHPSNTEPDSTVTDGRGAENEH